MYLDVSLHIIYINSKADRPFFRKVFQMTKKLIFKDSQNKHYEIIGSQKVFYFHHLGRYNNNSWSKVNLYLPDTDESFNFHGVNCVEQANLKLQELV